MRAALLVSCALLTLASATLSAAPRQGDDLADAGQAFLESLEAWRAGDDSAARGLEAASERMAALGRPDARSVARFYLTLDTAARAEGREHEQRYLDLRARLAAAEGLAPDAWAPLRAELTRALEALAEQAERQPDFTPAARARALLARIGVARLAGDSALTGVARDAVRDEVEQEAQRSLELFAQAGQLTPQLEPRWTLAELARAESDDATADAAFAGCAQLAERLQRAEWRERALLGRVALAREAGDVAAVERHLRALSSFRTPEACWPLVREEALTRYHADRPDEALDLLLDYPPRDARDRPDWHALLAAAYAREGRFDEAARETAALTELEGGGERARLADARSALMSGDLGRVLELVGDADRRAGLSPEGRASAAELAGRALLESGDARAASAALEEALSLADEWRSLSSGGAAGSIVGERVGLQTYVLAARAAAQAGDPLGAALLLERHQAAGLRRGAAPLGREELLAHAARFEGGLLGVTVGADDGLIYHVAADGRATCADLPHGRAAVARGVRRLREALWIGDEPRWRALAAELGETLIPAALRAALPEDAPLLVLAHGPLEALPWSALSIDGELLDERVELAVLPGLPALEARDARPGPPPSWNLFGAPPTRVHAPLAEARAELTELSRTQHGAGLHTGAHATREALLRALAQPRPLHVATHLVESDGCDGAHLSPEGLLVAGDEVVCAAELAGVPVASPLVVLLACRSGTGRLVDAEGLFGVGRALLEGGARSLVVTLWPIEDGGARDFARELHRGLALGWDPAAAARQARAELRAQGASPAVWAACRLLGRH